MIIRDSIVFTLFLVLKCSMSASIAELKANKSETECISNLNLSNPGIKDLCPSDFNLDVTNVSDEKFLFEFQDYLCFTVWMNIMVLCNSQKTSFKHEQVEQDHSKFCSSLPKIDIKEDCVPWLKAPQSTNASSDCQLQSRVVKAVIADEKSCVQNCIKSDKVDPVCVNLVETTMLLLEASKKGTGNDDQPSQPENVKENVASGNDSEQANKEKSLSPTTNSASQNISGGHNQTNASDAATPQLTKTSDQLSAQPIQTKNSPDAPTTLISTTLKPIENLDVIANEKTDDKSNKEKDIDSAGDLKDKEVKSVEEEEAVDISEEDVKNMDDPSSILIDEEEKKDSPDEQVVNKKDSINNKDSKEEALFSGPGIAAGPDIESESHFFTYFMLLSLVAIVAYLVFHNKQKILALILEGRRSQGNRRRSGGREYRKLDSNLEDTMDTGRDANLRQVIY